MVYGFSQFYDMYIWDMGDWEKNSDTGDERDMGYEGNFGILRGKWSCLRAFECFKGLTKKNFGFKEQNGAFWEHFSDSRV